MGLNSRVHFLKQESEMTIKDIIKINEVAKICKYSKVIKKVTYRWGNLNVTTPLFILLISLSLVYVILEHAALGVIHKTRGQN